MIQRLMDACKGKDLGFWVTLFVLILAVLALGFYGLIYGKNLDGISIIVGFLINAVMLLLNYRYGSSKGSKDKTELLEKKKVDG